MTEDIDDLLADAPADSAPTSPPLPVVPTFNPLIGPDLIWGYRCKADDVDKLKVTSGSAFYMKMVYDQVNFFLTARIPITAWGPVGVGKTDKTRSMSMISDENGLGYQVILITPSTEDPTVIHGIVYTSQETDGTTVMKRSMPEVVKRILEYATSIWEYSITTDNGVETVTKDTYLNAPPHMDDENLVEGSLRCVKLGGLTILFLDEMTTCMPAQQNALLGLLTHSEYGGTDLSPFISIMMAANPPGTVSTVQDLGEATMNRGGHVAWFGEKRIWIDGWRDGFGRPEKAPSTWVTNLVGDVMEHSDIANSIFRSPTWSPKDLVPWELLQNTPRTWDEFGKIASLIHDSFDANGGDPVIRDHYIAQSGGALLGREWEPEIKRSLERLRETISASHMLSTVRSSSLRWTTSESEFKSMHLDLCKWNGGVASHEQLDAVLQDLSKEVTLRGSYSQSAHLTMWAVLASIAYDIGMEDLRAYSDSLQGAVILGRIGISTGALTRETAAPSFVNADMRDIARQSRDNGRNAPKSGQMA